jgi:rieske iron-sulfur protein
MDKIRRGSRVGQDRREDTRPKNARKPPRAATGGFHFVGRRAVLQALLSSGLGLPLCTVARGQDEKPGSEDRPKPGDLFVFSEGDHEGEVVTPADLARDAEPIQAWPMDPQTKVVRDGSRLNQVLLLNLDPAAFDKDTLAYAADGIIAFSAICTHAGCPVTGWIESESLGERVLKCFCHNSEYDPRQGAAVVFGPAPRKLAVLPIRVADGALTVAKNFIGKVGPAQPA